MYALIWIFICLLVPLYSYNKILGIVIKKTKFKNQERSMFNHWKNELVVVTFQNLKAKETDKSVIKYYNKLILMLWIPFVVMGVGLLIMLVILAISEIKLWLGNLF